LKTRRQFISECALSLTALSLVPAGSFASAATTSAGSAVRLNHAGFSQQVNTVFKIRLADGKTANLTLLKAPVAPPCRMSGNKPPLDLNHEKFSLVFSGPTDVAIDSAIHQLEHEKLGRLEMHLGPIGTPGADGLRYEAVFNQPATI
jgi:hypothetical protein